MHDRPNSGVAPTGVTREGGARDLNYDARSTGARTLLDPRGADSRTGISSPGARRSVLDRLYALTPRGEVIDLPRGATPLDFAYQVHTQLGHSCRAPGRPPSRR